MFNTYGLQSVNSETFNLKIHTNYYFPKPLRDVIVTVLRVHNLVLNILGYIPGVSLISGCVRMLTGLTICLITLAIGDRDAHQGAIIGHWYDEALFTGVAQVARGAFEAFVPYGHAANLLLGVVGTLLTLGRGGTEESSVCTGCSNFRNHALHADASYPISLSFLYLV